MKNYLLRSRAIAALLLFLAGIGALSAAVALNTKQDVFSSLKGIQLVPPVFAQSPGTAPAFPDPEAGLSAYVNLTPVSVDFTDVANNVFTKVYFTGDNYIVGNVVVTTSSVIASTGVVDSTTPVNVRVYVDKSGLIIGYLPKNALSSQLFDWDEWDRTSPAIKTTLEEAMEKVAQSTMGTTITGAPLSWYHWGYPTATHILITAKTINRSLENLFLSIPSTGITLMETPSYSYRRVRYAGLTAYHLTYLNVMDGTTRIVNSSDFWGTLPLAFDKVYTFTNDTPREEWPSEVGVVVIYRAE